MNAVQSIGALKWTLVRSFERVNTITARFFRARLNRCVVAIFVLPVGLGGCVANMGYLMDTYGGVQKQVIDVQDGSFWVFDRPDLGKVLTTPSAGTTIGPALVRGLTLTGVDLMPLVQVHQEIALRWLRSTGRSCEIKTSSEIAKPEFEHVYVCSSKPAQIDAPKKEMK